VRRSLTAAVGAAPKPDDPHATILNRGLEPFAKSHSYPKSALQKLAHAALPLFKQRLGRQR
jgi:hypothetical protein